MQFNWLQLAGQPHPVAILGWLQWIVFCGKASIIAHKLCKIARLHIGKHVKYRQLQYYVKLSKPNMSSSAGLVTTIWAIIGVNVSSYSSTMEHMGRASPLVDPSKNHIVPPLGLRTCLFSSPRGSPPWGWWDFVPITWPLDSLFVPFTSADFGTMSRQQPTW